MLGYYNSATGNLAHLNSHKKRLKAMSIQLFNIAIAYFEQTVSQIYPAVLQFNRENDIDTGAFCFGYGLVHNKWHSFLKTLQ